MKDKSINVQDSILNQLRKEKKDVKIVLLNGKELEGTIKAFDNFTILLESEGEKYLIYKHSLCFLNYF